jgi:hypothetical protein
MSSGISAAARARTVRAVGYSGVESPNNGFQPTVPPPLSLRRACG